MLPEGHITYSVTATFKDGTWDESKILYLCTQDLSERSTSIRQQQRMNGSTWRIEQISDTHFWSNHQHDFHPYLTKLETPLRTSLTRKQTSCQKQGRSCKTPGSVYLDTNHG